MGVEPFLITSSMNAVIGQRLVRRICQKCKAETKLPEAVIERLKKELVGSNIAAELQNPATWKFYEAKGCTECNQGYRGRIGVFEILTMSETIEALAVKKAPASAIADQAIKEGMITMKQDGLVKALKGLTTIEEVMKATTE
jgi:type II secretory ATPase GspE/PulE/Tfp pilus assembly ATPase PilB-like protein